jgi:hypothetical protein
VYLRCSYLPETLIRVKKSSKDRQDDLAIHSRRVGEELLRADEETSVSHAATVSKEATLLRKKERRKKKELGWSLPSLPLSLSRAAL